MSATVILISPGAFQFLVLGALLLTLAAPLVLVGLWIRDRSKRQLW